MNVFWRLSFLAGLMLFAGASWAHKLAPSLLEFRAVGNAEYQVPCRSPADAQRPPHPQFPAACSPSAPNISPQGTALEWRWKLHCSSPLSGQSIAITGLQQSRTTALLRVQNERGELFETLLTADAPRFEFAEKASQGSVFTQYLGLGFSHILIGLDHLLFVAGLLLLVSTWRLLLLTITAFTVGHSITLVLVSIDVLPHWPALVELAIAATILLLALELTRPASGRAGGILRRHPWPMALLFGLVHGLGFAGVLAELGLPSGHLLKAVLAFNIGIELGQLVFVAALAAVLAALRSVSRWEPPLRYALIYSMGAISVFWCLDRGVSLAAELSRAAL